MGSATDRGRFFLLACCQDVLMLRETVCPKMGQTGCKKTRHKFSRNPKLVKRNKWWAEKGVIPDVKSLLTGNKSRNKHVFWSMVRWGQWWQQSKTQKKDKHIGLVHGLSEKLYLTWHFKLICPIFFSYQRFNLSSYPPVQPLSYTSSFEKLSDILLCLSGCFIKLLQMLNGCLSIWQFDTTTI